MTSVNTRMGIRMSTICTTDINISVRMAEQYTSYNILITYIFVCLLRHKWTFLSASGHLMHIDTFSGIIYSLLI